MAIPDLEIFWFWIDHRLRDIDFFLGKNVIGCSSNMQMYMI